VQKDFHYDVIYVLSQLAGFSPDESYKIAYSSQYVDDATNKGVVNFSNGAMYSRINSSHTEWELCDNASEVEDQFVWVPFHFLPGNCSLPEGEGDDQDFVDRLICRPNSYIARKMILECLNQKEKLSGYHRLGITLHVYADTWAHQGFAGIISDKNKIQNLQYADNAIGIVKFEENIMRKIDGILHDGINTCLPLGHGAALTYPDLPYLNNWSFDYQDFRGTVSRNNTDLFIEAADYIYKILTLYKQGVVPDNLDTMFEGISGLSSDLKEHLERAFTNFTGKPDERHKDWLKEINSGSFAGVTQIPEYYSKGMNSWKYLALGTELAVDIPGQTFDYRKDFIVSDWKLFHDALQLHRTYILNELLPQYGICAA
jgi:hypothetical protein